MNKFTDRVLQIGDLETSKIAYGKYYLDEKDVYTVDVEGITATLKYLCSRFTISKIIYNEDTQTFKYELFLQTPKGEEEVVEEKSIFTSRKLDNLIQKGFSFDPDRAKEVQKLAQLQEENARLVTEYSYIGFKNNHFWGFPSDEDKRCVSRIKLQESPQFEKAKLNNLLKNAPLLQLALTISASSAVQGFLGQKLPLSTVVYHFYGDSSQGKTTALMANAVWGKPTVETGLLTTWNQTELSLMNLLTNNFGVTVALDESSICRFDLTSTLYNLSQGVNRQRLQKNQQQQPTKEWLTTILSSGESSLLEHTNNNTGLKARVIEFSEPVTLSAEHSNSCKSFFLSNYGHIGRKIVEYLEECSLGDYLKTFNAERETFLATVPESEKSPLTERLADNFTVLILTAQILNTLRFNIKIEAIMKLLLKKNNEIGERFNIGQIVFDKICDRIINKRTLYPDKQTHFGLSSIEGIVNPNGEVILLESTFDKIIKENNFSSKLVCLRALDKMKLLKKQRKDTYYSKITINKVPVKVLIIHLNYTEICGRRNSL